MEITGLLTFAAIFITILLVLISIAYYGIKEPTYNEAAASSNETKKKSKKDSTNKKQTSKTLTATTTSKKQPNVKEETNEAEKEEDPIVVIPDPFTLQLSSRFAGATRAGPSTNGQNAKKEVYAAKFSKPKDDVVTESAESLTTAGAFSSNKTQEKVKPKATVKPNQNYAPLESEFSNDFQVKTATTLNGSVPMTQAKEVKSLKATTKPAENGASSGDSLLVAVNNQLRAQLKQMETAEIGFASKLKELNLDLSEKIKQIDSLNRANLASKTEIAR